VQLEMKISPYQEEIFTFEKQFPSYSSNQKNSTSISISRFLNIYALFSNFRRTGFYTDV